MNSVTLGGRLQDIVSYRVFTNRRTGKPNPSLIFTMYTTRPFKQNGQYQNDFFHVVCHGPSAQFAKQYGQKGGLVSVHGRLQNHSYNHVVTNQIIADDVELPRPSRNVGSFTQRQPSNGGGNRMQQPNAPRTNNNGFNRGAGAPNRSFNNRMNRPAPNNAPMGNRPNPQRPVQQNPQGQPNNRPSQPMNRSSQPTGQNSRPNNPNPNSNPNHNPITPDGKDLPF